MKIATCLAMEVVFCGVFCLAQTSPSTPAKKSVAQTPGYTVTVTEPANPISLESSIIVNLTVNNITNADISWRWRHETGEDLVYKAFHFMLKKDGREVETTLFHRKITGRQREGDPKEIDEGGTVLIAYPPGIMFTSKIDLRRLYEIIEPGQYTLEISRIAEDNKTVVHSNTVTLNIVP